MTSRVHFGITVKLTTSEIFLLCSNSSQVSLIMTRQTDLTPEEENLINKELIPTAGKVELDPPMMWGKGLINEMRVSLLKWWVVVGKEIICGIPSHLIPSYKLARI